MKKYNYFNALVNDIKVNFNYYVKADMLSFKDSIPDYQALFECDDITGTNRDNYFYDLSDNESKVAAFSCMLDNLDILQNALKESGRHYYRALYDPCYIDSMIREMMFKKAYLHVMREGIPEDYRTNYNDDSIFADIPTKNDIDYYNYYSKFHEVISEFVYCDLSYDDLSQFIDDDGTVLNMCDLFDFLYDRILTNNHIMHRISWFSGYVNAADYKDVLKANYELLVSVCTKNEANLTKDDYKAIFTDSNFADTLIKESILCEVLEDFIFYYDFIF